MREIIQKQAVEKYFDKGIYYLCPRFGKIKTTFDLCNKHNWLNIKVLAPRVDIFEGWKNDKDYWDFKGNLKFCTFTSVEKEVYENIDLVVIDEIHEASDGQLKAIKKVVGNNKSIALTGTMTNKTFYNIQDKLGMNICHKYTIQQGVEDGILTDYCINIHLVDLDNKNQYISTKKGYVTENQRFKQFLWLKNKLENEEKSTFFLDLKLISLIQNSIAKIEKTKELINQNKNNRVLVFCGTTETADKLGIPVYHSKSKEKQLFFDFCSGLGLHMASIKMMQAGITVKPIHLGVINYTSGNPEDTAQKICRFLGIEYDTLDKKAHIDLVCSNTEFEKERIKTALMFFDENKITWLKK